MSVVLLLILGRVYQLVSITHIFRPANYLKKHYILLLLCVKYIVPILI